MNLKSIIISFAAGMFFAISIYLIIYIFYTPILWIFLFAFIFSGAFSIYIYKILIDQNLSRGQATQIGMVTSGSFLATFFLIGGILTGQFSIGFIWITFFALIFSLFFSVIFATLLIKSKEEEEKNHRSADLL